MFFLVWSWFSLSAVRGWRCGLGWTPLVQRCECRKGCDTWGGLGRSTCTIMGFCCEYPMLTHMSPSPSSSSEESLATGAWQRFSRAGRVLLLLGDSPLGLGQTCSSARFTVLTHPVPLAGSMSYTSPRRCTTLYTMLDHLSWILFLPRTALFLQ